MSVQRSWDVGLKKKRTILLQLLNFDLILRGALVLPGAVVGSHCLSHMRNDAKLKAGLGSKSKVQLEFKCVKY